MAKKEQLIRLVYIVKALEKAPQEGLSYQEIYDFLKRKHEDKDCEKFSFSEKTFQRDRGLLQDIFMICIAPKGKGKWVIEKNELTNRYAIFDNILLVDAYRRTKEMQEVLLFEQQEKTLGLHYIEDIIEAIEKHRTLRFVYTKFWEGVPHLREVIPYALKEYKRRWYLIAEDNQGDNRIKTFGLDRISQLEITQTKVQHKKVDIETLFKNSYGITIDTETPPQEIILSFDYQQGQYIKTLPLHPSQEVLIDNEKEVRIRLKLIPNYDFVTEICARSLYVKVISPSSLAEEVKGYLKEAYEQYLS